jgi:hypothetical protein
MASLLAAISVGLLTLTSPTSSLPAPSESAWTPASDVERFIYPLAPQRAAPPIVIDVSEAPGAETWANRARLLAIEWFPKICSLLATEDWTPPKEIRLVFKADLNVPAHASRDTITINGKWIASRPDDFGMVIHELVHVVQAYPGSRHKPGWLVEGIADYIRWWRYEPEAPRHRIDREKASYRDAYRTTAWFLAWTSAKYDRRLVPALDRALRKAEDPLPVFLQMTGKDIDALWSEFVASL